MNFLRFFFFTFTCFNLILTVSKKENIIIEKLREILIHFLLLFIEMGGREKRETIN